MIKKSFLSMILIVVTTLLMSQETKRLVILHTNDMHSRLMGYAPEGQYSPATTGDDHTIGGFARLATVLKSEREKMPEETLILDGGDFLMGTLFHHIEEQTGFQLWLMKKMGYDVAAIGNHEFDYGPETLGRIIYKSAERGPIPALLLSNAVTDPVDIADDVIESAFNDNLITRTTILEKNGLKIGFFSLMGVDADDVAPYAPPVTFSKQKRAARKMVKELKGQDCDLIICLSHSGLAKDKKGRWRGEDYKLARRVKGIDIIVSGHTHSKIEEPLNVKGTLIIQSGYHATYVGRLEVEVENDKVSQVSYKLIPVDDSVAGDPEFIGLIDAQALLVDSLVLRPLGLSYTTPIILSTYELVCDEYTDLEGSNLGPMVADAVHAFVNNHTVAGSDISLVAAGVIRDRIKPGIQTIPDIFNVMSLGSGADGVPGYPLSRVYVTGKELKSILEVLLIAYRSSTSNYCYYSGVKVFYDPDKMILRKIKSIEIADKKGDFHQIDLSKDNTTLYSIAANSYILEFVGIIKSMSFGLLKVVPKHADGTEMTDMKEAVIDFSQEGNNFKEGKEWLALKEFFCGMKDADGDGIKGDRCKIYCS